MVETSKRSMVNLLWPAIKFHRLCYTTCIGRGGAVSNPKQKRYSIMEQQLPLAGKIALITGSSQGIGRATATCLARSGADIIINYRSNADAAAEVKATIEEMGRRCIAVQADVSQKEDVSRLFAASNEALGPIAILGNNAGTTRDKLIIQMSLTDFEHVLDTNLRSAFLCTKP